MEEETYIRWNGNSQNAQLLQSLLRSGAIPASWGALKVQQQYPQFAVYRTENFGVTLSRFRKKLCNTRQQPVVAPTEQTPQEYAENFLPAPRTMIMNRSTPAPLTTGFARSTPVTAPRIRFAEPELEVPEEEEEEINEEIGDEMPKFGTPSVTASESQYKFGSTCSEVVCPYEILPWSLQTPTGRFRNHCSVCIWLLSVSCVSTVTTRVSNDQKKLEVYTRLPTILDVDRVDERNSKCYKTSTGEPTYPPTHIRSIAHKQALGTLPRNEKGEVQFKQTICLPFRVCKEPVQIGTKQGVQTYFFGHQGEIKIMVVELVSSHSQVTCNPTYTPRTYEMVEDCARSRRHHVLSGATFYSVDPSTGTARNRHMPTEIGVNCTSKDRFEGSFVSQKYRVATGNASQRSNRSRYSLQSTSAISCGGNSKGSKTAIVSRGVAKLPPRDEDIESLGEESTIRTKDNSYKKTIQSQVYDVATHSSRASRKSTNYCTVNKKQKINDTDDDDDDSNIINKKLKALFQRKVDANINANKITQQNLSYDENYIENVYKNK